jgi:hypothetical protein
MTEQTRRHLRRPFRAPPRMLTPPSCAACSLPLSRTRRHRLPPSRQGHGGDPPKRTGRVAVAAAPRHRTLAEPGKPTRNESPPVAVRRRYLAGTASPSRPRAPPVPAPSRNLPRRPARQSHSFFTAGCGRCRARHELPAPAPRAVPSHFLNPLVSLLRISPPSPLPACLSPASSPTVPAKNEHPRPHHRAFAGARSASPVAKGDKPLLPRPRMLVGS